MRPPNDKGAPCCLKCGSTEISFDYLDGRDCGTAISERAALGMAVMWINEEIGHSDDPDAISQRAHTLFELAVMWSRRPAPEEEDVEAES